MSTIKRLRVGWTVARSFPEQMSGDAGTPQISTWKGYRETFTTAGEATQENGWRHPWFGQDSYSTVWGTTFGPKYWLTVRAGAAWDELLVPLMRPGARALKTAVDGVVMSYREYLSATGVAVVVSAEFTGELDAGKALKLVRRLRTDAVHQVDAEPARAINAVLTALIDTAQANVFGTTTVTTHESARTTVLTITESTGWAPSARNADLSARRVLYGLATRSATIPTSIPAEAAGAFLTARTAFPRTIRVFLGDVRATVSTIPSPDDESVEDLECYHQNQVLAALQVSILLAAVAAMGSPPLHDTTSDQDVVFRNVVRLLGPIYGQGSKIYSTDFDRRQIDASGLIEVVEDIRESYGLDGLLIPKRKPADAR